MRGRKPGNSMWSSDFTQLAEGKNDLFKFSSTAERFQRKRSPRSASREEASVLCALPFFVFTAAVVCASLDRVAGGPHRCAAVSLAVINIAAEPDSSESSQWQPRRGRDAGSDWLRGAVSQPRPFLLRSLFSSMSSSVGGEARCKKCPSSAAITHTHTHTHTDSHTEVSEVDL